MSRWRVSQRRYAVSENEPSHCTKGPEWAGIRTFRKSPVAHDCVVVDAARIEPVSTPNSLLDGAGNFLELAGNFFGRAGNFVSEARICKFGWRAGALSR